MPAIFYPIVEYPILGYILRKILTTYSRISSLEMPLGMGLEDLGKTCKEGGESGARRMPGGGRRGLMAAIGSEPINFAPGSEAEAEGGPSMQQSACCPASEYMLRLYRSMLLARELDRVEEELTRRGEAFFHVSGAGHEGTAALAPHLIAGDYLHCHYRDKALMIARGIPVRAFLDSLLCKDASHSRGRQMSAHMCDRRLNVLSIVGPVGNSALQAAGVAAAIKDRAGVPIVLCSLGDGSTQEGEFLEACAEAVRAELPVLFLVGDNGWSISTRTRGRTFYSRPDGPATEFYGMPIHRVDGRDPAAAMQVLGSIVDGMRCSRRPALVVFEVERLADHTNADDQGVYREEADIGRAKEEGDPIRRLERHLLAAGWSESLLRSTREQVVAEVAAAEREAAAGADPEAVFTARQPVPAELTDRAREYRGSAAEAASLTMREALRDVLRHHLVCDESVVLFGEDIEDPKGDVFGVTQGLSTEFPARVINSALSESTIIGVSCGRALAGQRPVAFLQFADFLPLAYNQIVSEIGSLYWRTDGQWTAPVIVMVACGGYRPGLGPFHAQTFESIAAHTPGVDVFMPSGAADAAGLLNAAFASGRPTIFFYPKRCLNDPKQATSPDVERQFVPIGAARKARAGRDITMVGWGNTVRLCEKAADALEEAGLGTEIIDLRSLSPWDERTVLASAEKTGHLLVVHEDNLSCGLGAEVLATVAEQTGVPVAMRRIARPDTFVPCNFANQLEVLPSFKSVLAAAAGLLDLDLDWLAPPAAEAGVACVEAIGSAPSDETVIVVELMVAPGMRVERGQPIAAIEATKSLFELTAAVSGQVSEILVSEGDTVPVGTPLMKIRTPEPAGRTAPVTQEQPGTPVLRRRAAAARRTRVYRRNDWVGQLDVGISSCVAVEGGRRVTNADLLPSLVRGGAEGGESAPLTSEDIVRRTGIETRHWIKDGEDAVTLAQRACGTLLDREGLAPEDVDLLICSTTSPGAVTPSMACRVLNALARSRKGVELQAYDVNAACSGYLYALQAGFDYLQSRPHARVLIVTSEVLSPLLDLQDFDTAILFGDAASATLLQGEARFDRCKARLYRPELSARGDFDGALSVPFPGEGHIRMKGRKVFGEAVRAMVDSLAAACRYHEIDLSDLSMIIPHQANQRIIDAVQDRVGVSVYSNIKDYGNTSSTSIPLCLSEVLEGVRKGERLGLCAFGGGFTFGAGIVEAL